MRFRAPVHRMVLLPPQALMAGRLVVPCSTATRGDTFYCALHLVRMTTSDSGLRSLSTGVPVPARPRRSQEWPAKK